MASAVFRVVFGVIVILLFVGSVVGILVTGPVAVRVRRIEIDPPVDVARLRANVEKLCGDLAPRSHRDPERLLSVADWIAAGFREAGLEVENQDYHIGRQGFRNVIAVRPGTDPELGVYVVGAHYDAYGDHPGADDNASGVAVLLELALTLPEVDHRRTHVFAAFSTEEPPYFGSEQMGSYVFANKLVDEGTPVALMISLDMVGYYSDEPGSQGLPLKILRLYYPDRGDFVAIVGDADAGRWIERVKRGMTSVDSIPLHSFRASPRWAPVDLSDHWSFRQLGLPGVQVTDTAFMRNPHYHTADDTPETLNYERMAALVRALHGVLWE